MSNIIHGRKRFLKPEWKKFVLPAILLAIFLLSVGTSYYSGSVENKYICEMTSLFQELKNNFEKNDSLAVNQTLLKIMPFSENMRSVESLLPIISFMAPLKIIDPIAPFPCELLNSYQFSEQKANLDDFCEYYISKESYDCATNLYKLSNLSVSGFSLESYRNASPISLGLNVLLLFIEGYLISAVILFIYRKARKRPEQNHPDFH